MHTKCVRNVSGQHDCTQNKKRELIRDIKWKRREFPITAGTAIKWRSALYLIQMFKKCGQKTAVQTFSLLSKTVGIVIMTVQDS